MQDEGAASMLDVRVTYTGDGKNWNSRPMSFDDASDTYQAAIAAPSGANNIFVIVEARDHAGNIATYTGKGKLMSYSMVRIPIVRR